jgi:diguanylate cyclase (GGDEF)-like protein/PAS domain S-box-containing protein
VLLAHKGRRFQGMDWRNSLCGHGGGLDTLLIDPPNMSPITGYARELLDASPDAMIVADSDGTLVYVNGQTVTLFGYTSEELIGKPVEMLLPQRYRTVHPGLRASFAQNPSLRPMGGNREVYARHRDGSEIRVEIRLSALQTDKGLLLSSTIRDIGARGEHPGQTRELSAARERARETLNSIGDAFISSDPAGKVTYLNPVAERLTGWSQADAAGQPLQQVFAIIKDSVRESILTPLLAVIEDIASSKVSSNGMLTRRNAPDVAIEYSTTPMMDDPGAVVGAVTVFRDASVANAITSKLAYAAHHDALTGLPNRLLLESRIPQAIALARRHNYAVAVLFLDLDGFKLVNDTFGHPAGDRLLQSVARVLERCVRSSDTVCRFGGDEFVVLLSEIARPADAVVSSQKILEALRIPHTIDAHTLLVTASIGVGLFPHDGMDSQTLLHNADDAMFHAKRPGGNDYRFWSRSGEYL